jgi:hypothetical protein
VFANLAIHKLFWSHSGLFKDGAESSFWHIARMIGNSRIPASGGIEPDLMAAGSLSIELESEGFQTLNNLTIPEPSQSPN